MATARPPTVMPPNKKKARRRQRGSQMRMARRCRLRLKVRERAAGEDMDVPYRMSARQSPVIGGEALAAKRLQTAPRQLRVLAGNSNRGAFDSIRHCSSSGCGCNREDTPDDQANPKYFGRGHHFSK